MQSLNLRTQARQQQTLSPRLQQAVRLLQLSSLDFAQEVHNLLDHNPFVDSDELDVPAAPVEADAESDVVEEAHETWQGDGLSRVRRADDGETSALDLMAFEPSLAAHLHAQLDLLPLPERDRALAKAVVESLDDDGYLRQPLNELVDENAISPPASEHEWTIALRRVQSLDPAGVGARNLAECLTLQLPAIEEPQVRALAQRIVCQHLDLLADGNTERLVAVLDSTPADIGAACERIRRLDPHPGWRCGGGQAQYIVPDVIVRKVRSTWIVQLNPVIVPKLRINQVYAELFQRHRRANDEVLAGHLQEARWMMHNVEQRFATIVSVAEAIVKRQRRFFELGPMAMRPMGLREIADEVGLHESTVSRVTNNKYMSTPQGVFELKHFFSRAMTTASGSTCSGTALRELIKDMIAAETPDAPLSDVAIAKQLSQQGLLLARRTVTKYRKLLRIEPVGRRRAKR